MVCYKEYVEDGIYYIEIQKIDYPCHENIKMNESKYEEWKKEKVKLEY